MARTVGESAGRELSGLTLGDRRIDARALEIASRIAAAPQDSFPEQMSSEAELEALYRFFANPKVTMDGLLAPHVRATHERVAAHRVVRVIHDTTSFRFGGDRDGLGVLIGSSKGFFAHTTLAVAGDATNEPLGVLAIRPFIHTDTVARRKMTQNERVRETRARARTNRESCRWEQQALDVQAALPASTHAIHLMDQEGDDFEVYTELLRANVPFVIRMKPGRITSENAPANMVLARVPAMVFRKVRLSERKKNTKKHPARPERDAELEIRWGSFDLFRRYDVEPRTASLNAVHVFEPNPPPGQDAIEWLLVTNETIENLDDATAIVDHYRARWMIEEYFKALKTGCAFEKRQLTSFDGLTKALALFAPIAWSLLVLRHVSRVEPTRRATLLFSTDELLLLRALIEERKQTLPTVLSARDAMLAIARLGGHIRNNGDPGWAVLGRGYLRFAEAKAVWDLARRYDQS